MPKQSEGRIIVEDGALRATLIREGKSKNGNVWTRAVIRQLAKISEGVPIHFYDMSRKGDGSFSSHWESLRAKLPPMIANLLPERLPGAQVGVVRNPVAVDDNGVLSLKSEIELAEDAGWFRTVVDRFKSVGKSLGLSIHVPADGMTAVSVPGGLEPEEVTRVVGYDVVSFPSAGGAFEAVLEALTEEQMKGLVGKLLRHVPKAKRRALLAKIGDDHATVDKVSTLLEDHGEFVEAFLEAVKVDVEEDQRGPVLNALACVEAVSAPAPKKAAKKAKPRQTTLEDLDDPDDDDDGDADPPAVTRAQFDGLSEDVKRVLQINARSVVRSAITEAKLPKGLADFATAHFEAQIEAGTIVEDDTVRAFVKDLKTGIGNAEANGGGLLEATVVSVTFPEFTNGEKALAAFDAMMDGEEFATIGEGDNAEKIRAFRGIKEAYQVLTGDILCDGADFYARPERSRQKGLIESINMDENPYHRQFVAMRGLVEAMTTASFPNILSDRMHKRMAKEYRNLPHFWQMISSIDSVSDFKTWRIDRMGEYPNLANVAENGAYADLGADPTEEEVTYALQKRGGTSQITWEMIVNDDLRQIRRIPRKLARAAERTINSDVWGFLLNNSAIYDALALAHATHTNLSSVAYAYSELETMRRRMIQQKDIDSIEAGRATPRHVFCGPNLYDQIYSDLFSSGKPNLDFQAIEPANTGTATVTLTRDNPSQPNFLRSRHGLSLTEILEFDEVAGSESDYWLTADPADIEMVAVAFLNGRRDPQLFVQDLDRVGVFFTNEQILYKVRHIWASVVVDYRGFQGGIAP